MQQDTSLSTGPFRLASLIPRLTLACLAATVVLTVGYRSARSESESPTQFAITDLLPPNSFADTTKTRVIVKSESDGSLKAYADTPAHRQEMFLGNTRLTLGEGASPFSPPRAPSAEEVAHTGLSTAGGTFVAPEWYEGAEHILVGTLKLGEYTFESDPAYPLVFKIVKDRGYVRLCGRGTVMEKSGARHPLGGADTIQLWTEQGASTELLEREGAAQALGYLAAQAGESDRRMAVESLVKLLQDGAGEIRRNAIEALIRIGDKSARNSIHSMAESDQDEWVRNVAQWALQQFEESQGTGSTSTNTEAPR